MNPTQSKQPNTLSRIGEFIANLMPANVTHYVAPAQPIQQPHYRVYDRGVSLTQADLDTIKPVIYGEISNRTPDKQTLEANVILNTALNRMKAYAAQGTPKTLSQVISMPQQYQAYGGQQYKNYSTPPDPVAQAKVSQVNSIVDSFGSQIKSGAYKDNTKGAYYYVHNPDGSITYDNTRPLFAGQPAPNAAKSPRSMGNLNTPLQ